MGKKVPIIGGRLGGVSAAIHLKTAGYDVELHEKNDHVGGKLNLMERVKTDGKDIGEPHIGETRTCLR